MSPMQWRMVAVLGVGLAMVAGLWVWRPWATGGGSLFWLWVRDFLHGGLVAAFLMFLYVRWIDQRRAARRARRRQA